MHPGSGHAHRRAGDLRHGDAEVAIAPARQATSLVKEKTERSTIMAAEKQQNLQDVFLNHVRKNKVPVTVFLINGVKLQGVISSFDNFCLLLRRDGHVQLVYKHAVSTVMPSAAVRLYEPAADEQQPVQG
jgi:host factor-I protein